MDQQQLSTRGLPSRPQAGVQAAGLGVTAGKQPSELQKVSVNLGLLLTSSVLESSQLVAACASFTKGQERDEVN